MKTMISSNNYITSYDYPEAEIKNDIIIKPVKFLNKKNMKKDLFQHLPPSNNRRALLSCKEAANYIGMTPKELRMERIPCSFKNGKRFYCKVQLNSWSNTGNNFNPSAF